MNTASCQRFLDVFDNYRDGVLNDTDHLAVAAHLDQCEDCRRLFETHEKLSAALSRMEMDPLRRRRIAVAAANLKRPVRKPLYLPKVILRPLGAVSALALLILAVVRLTGNAPTGETAATPPDEPLAAAPKRYTPDLSLETTVTPDGNGVIEIFPGTALWLHADTEVEIRALGQDMVEFYLKSGRVVAEVGTAAPGFRFIVSTALGAVEARGTLFTVEVGPNGNQQTAVAEGAIEFRSRYETKSAVVTVGKKLVAVAGLTRVEPFSLPNEPGQSPICLIADCRDAVPAGEARSARLGAKTKLAKLALKEDRLRDATRLVNELHSRTPGRAETIALLAELARAYRRAKMFEEARNVYLRLIREHPASQAATDSLVALGQIEYRTLNRPREALECFDRYLERQPEGFLAETARTERVRVLARQGRHGQVVTAAEVYLSHHPRGFAAAELRRRKANALSALGRCAAAITEYDTLIRSWPDSKEAAWARHHRRDCQLGQKVSGQQSQ
jgi:hypothetical protein